MGLANPLLDVRFGRSHPQTPHMSDARFLDPHPTSTPTGAGAPDAILPDDLSEEAAGRLRIA